MNAQELQRVLAEHAKWVSREGGQRANLKGADLQGADLQGANLQRANLVGANLRGADLQDANLRDANLRRADLRRADLRHAGLQDAELRGADLEGADLDFSVWPLWCGSIGAIVDDRIQRQLLYHAYATDNPEQDADIAELFQSELVRRVIAKFHRFEECGGFRHEKLKEEKQ